MIFQNETILSLEIGEHKAVDPVQSLITHINV